MNPRQYDQKHQGGWEREHQGAKCSPALRKKELGQSADNKDRGAGHKKVEEHKTGAVGSSGWPAQLWAEKPEEKVEWDDNCHVSLEREQTSTGQSSPLRSR